MDAVEAQCPALLGISEGGPMSILFAATYPERVRSMVLYGTLPRFSPDPPDYLGVLTALSSLSCRTMSKTIGATALWRISSSASPTMAWMLL